MPFRSALPTVFGLALLAVGQVRAEDPFLGQIKEIKCVNCKPGWVTLVVHDPIETRDFELYLKDSDYNKIIAPLPGKSIRDRDGQCFYWMEKPKAKKPGIGKGPSQPAPALADKGPAKQPAPGAAGEKNGELTRTGAAAADSTALLPVSDTENVVPPPSPESEGTPSACIRFYRQMN
jgi:hypothetical protein